MASLWIDDVEDDILLCVDRRRHELDEILASPARTFIDVVRFINDVAGDAVYFFEAKAPLDQRLLDLIREATKLVPWGSRA